MNLTEYVEKFGGYTFEEKPFNHVEATIFTALSYAPFEIFAPSIAEPEKEIFFRDFTEENLAALGSAKTLGKENGKLIRLMYNSPRYRDVSVRFCMKISDEEVLEQFFALTFHIPHYGFFLGYRGTDSSIIGWKENLTLFYKNVTLAQLDSIEYLLQVLKNIPGEQITVGGHSKGGNLVIYALFFSDEATNARIKRAYSFDGFGMYSKEYRSFPNYEASLSRLVQIVPRDSFVGELFYTPNNQTVISSQGKNLIQHNPFFWEITEEGDFAYIKNRSFKTRLMHRTLKKWSQRGLKEDRELFFTVLGKALSGQNGRFEIYGEGSGNKAGRIMQTARDSFPPKERIRFYKYMLMFAGSFVSALFFYVIKTLIYPFRKRKNKR